MAKRKTWKQVADEARLKNSIQNASLSVDTTQYSELAENVVESLTNSLETTVGGVSGQVQGGVKSLTSKVDQINERLNNLTTEGLLDEGAQSIENLTTDLMNTAISSLSGGLGTAVEVQFSDPDSNGVITPISSSLDADGGFPDTVAGIIGAITGLGSGAGALQKAVMDASPEGLLNIGSTIAGKIGAFAASEIESLINDAINSVTDGIDAALPSLTDPNRTITFPNSWDSNGVILTFDSVTSSAPTANAEGTTASNYMKQSRDDAKTILNKTEETKQNLNKTSDFENVSGGKDGKTVVKSIQKKDEDRNRFIASTEEYRGLVRTRIAKNPDLGIIQSLSSENLQSITETVQKFAPSLSIPQAKRVIVLSQGDRNQFYQAVQIITSKTDKSYQDVVTFLKTIDTTISNSIKPDVPSLVFSEPYVIGTYEWNKGEGNPVFPYISSTEELEAEFRNADRDITEMVVHWTETHTNKNIGAEEINKYHLASGLEGCGYHYIIRRDGTLQRGRPLNIEGQHTPTNNHNQRSIGVVFVGGINVPTGTPNSEKFISVRSLTRSQFNTFDHICRTFYNVFAGGQVLGHNDLDDTQVDPDFDVREYVKANFDKDSKFSNPLIQEPFTKDEINRND